MTCTGHWPEWWLHQVINIFNSAHKYKSIHNNQLQCPIYYEHNTNSIYTCLGLYVPLQIHLALSSLQLWLQGTGWHRCCPDFSCVTRSALPLSLCASSDTRSMGCLNTHEQPEVWEILQPMGQTLTSVELELMDKCLTLSSFQQRHSIFNNSFQKVP